MPEPIAPPPVSIEERAAWSPLERIRALEVYQSDHDRRIVELESGDKSMSVRFDKLQNRITLASGVIIGASVALKLVPPGVADLLKHALGG